MIGDEAALAPAMDAVADLELAIVSHRVFDEAIESVGILLARARHRPVRREGRRLKAQGMLLLGGSGSGKSTIIQRTLDLNLPESGEDGIVMPVAVAEVPPAPTLRGVVDAIYSALGYRAERALSAEDIIKDLVGKAELLGTAVLLLDESHHILASREADKVTEFLKSLLNRLGCSMVFAGLEELTALRDSLQLSRRLFPDVVLRPYRFTNTVERLEFMSFLAAVERNALKLSQRSDLSSQNVARRLYAASGGLIGIVVKYLSHAVLLANLRGLDRIDLPLLAEIDASWTGRTVAPDDIGFDEDVSFDEGLDVADLLARAGRVRIDEATNPFACAPNEILAILEKREAQRIVDPQRRRLDRRMKGAGPDPQRAFS